MRRILVCTGVLGGGTALVFALAAATAILFPQGTLVTPGWSGNIRLGGPVNVFGIGAQQTVIMDEVVVAVPAEGPAIAVPEAIP